MSATVTVDREALRRLLFEVDALGCVEHLRFGELSSYANHIWRLGESFKRTSDPREGFEEGLSEDESDAVDEVRELHARHLFRSLVIEDMLYAC